MGEGMNLMINSKISKKRVKCMIWVEN